MPQTWMNALERYSYKVDLACYKCAGDFPDFFKRQITGDRSSTIDFEDYFRANTQKVEVWYEVVFWKLHNYTGIRNKTTTRVVQRLNLKPMVAARELIPALKSFVDDPNRDSFNCLRKLFFESDVIATTATFPAFFDPKKFPMVDTRVANWVNSQLGVHNTKNPDTPQLIRSQYGPDRATVLTMTDFEFYLHWINWTRYMANKLSQLTEMEWRARDVEMAVFTAWGERGCFHPWLRLNAI